MTPGGCRPGECFKSGRKDIASWVPGEGVPTEQVPPGGPLEYAVDVCMANGVGDCSIWVIALEVRCLTHAQFDLCSIVVCMRSYGLQITFWMLLQQAPDNHNF